MMTPDKIADVVALALENAPDEDAVKAVKLFAEPVTQHHMRASSYSNRLKDALSDAGGEYAKIDIAFGLRLGNLEIEPGTGKQHELACLDALARY